MKKYFVFLIFNIFVVSPTWADTDSKVSDFLNKVNSYYYCLSDAGLKTIQFKASISVPDPVLTILKTKYDLSDDMIKSLIGVEFIATYKMGENNWKVLPSYIESNDSPKVVAIVQSLYEHPPKFIKSKGSKSQIAAWQRFEEQWKTGLYDFLTQWKCTQIWPIVRLDSEVPFHYTVQNKSDGFNVTANVTGPVLLFNFDRQAKLLSYSSLLGNDSSTSGKIFFDFSKNRNVYILNGVLEDDQSDLRDQYRATYQYFGNFLVPKGLYFDRKSSRANSDTFQINYFFSDYKINQ